MEDGFGLEIIGLLILIICSAFFSGSETAFTAASKARLANLEKDGDSRAKLLNKLREHSEHVISSILFGNNLVNILASSIATSALIKIFGEAGIAYATLGVTFLVLVFAEVMPKTYALLNPEITALRVAHLLDVLVKVFSPITFGVTKIVNFIFKCLGVKEIGISDEHEEELRGAIQIFKDNIEERDEQQKGFMLRSILDLAEIEVEEIMVHRKNVKMIDADTPINELIEDVMSSPYTRMPVWKGDKDNIIGVIHSKLLLRELLECGGDISKLNILKTMIEPWFIPESTTLYDQLEAFRKRREHFSIMVDEYGAFMGIVTLEDILEEIVGEINDEYDVDVLGIKAQPDGSYLIDGDVTIRDINRELNWDLPDDEYSTLAGLMLFETRSIPSVAQVYDFYDYKFEVVKRVKNQLSLIKVTPLKSVM